MPTIPRHLRPPHLRPARLRPLGLRPDDARAYRIYARPTRDAPGTDDELAAEVAPGTSQAIIEGDPDSEAWYHVKAVSRLGREDTEPVEPRLRRVAFDGDGHLILPVPNAPSELVVLPRAAGQMIARWHYEPLHQPIAPGSFNVYVATGAGAFDFDNPAHTVDVPGSLQRRYEQDLGTFAHDELVRVIVRAVSIDGGGGGGEETNTIEAEAHAHDQAPAPATSLRWEVSST